MPNKEEIARLVARYTQNRRDYIKSSSAYNETDTRAELIDPFFDILGWDIRDEKGLPNRLREVIRETRVDVEEARKRPDYEFKLGYERKFFVDILLPLRSRPPIRHPKGSFSAFAEVDYGARAGEDSTLDR